MPKSMLIVSFLFTATVFLAEQPAWFISADKIGSVNTGRGEGAAEIVAYAAANQSLYIVNAADNSLDIVSITDAHRPDVAGVRRIDLAPYGAAPNSVAVAGDLVAVAVEADAVDEPGSVVLFGLQGDFIRSIEAGVLPDMLAFTPDSTRVLVANEGEPSADYDVDPPGSITIIDLSRGAEGATATTAGFTSFDDDADRLRALGVRLFGPNASVAQDLEPEYIAVSPDSRTAWVTLQENNAIAEVDVNAGIVVAIHPLGYKDYSLPGNEIDASDRDGRIDIRSRPVRALYQPDGIAAFSVGGAVFLATANEGEARDYRGFSEEVRVEDISLDLKRFPDAAALQDSSSLGRLNTTRVDGDLDGDGDHDIVYSYGARSFSIWQPVGGALQRVYDSGNEFAVRTATLAPEGFNANRTVSQFDSRSDAKGVEPEAVVVGAHKDHTYAFVAMERGLGGVMMYDVTNPRDVHFVTWILSNDGSHQTGQDISPEGLLYINADDSPTGTPLLVVAHEFSGTVAIYELTFAQESES